MANVSVYGAGASAIRQYADAFAQYTEGTAVADIETLFRRLGKIGSGLNALLQKSPAMGKLFGAINNLSLLTSLAAVNKASCNKICALGFDVLVVLDTAGRKGAEIDGDMLAALASCFEDINALVDGFVQEGWLLRIACNERMKEEFDTLHEAVIEMLKGSHLSTMPDGRALPAANYRDAVKPLRRSLKAMGRGNLTAGVLSLRDNEKSLGEVARLLDVQPEALAVEIAQVPDSDLDLDTLYQNLIQRNGKLQHILDNQHCSISPEISSVSLGAADANSGAAHAGLYADLFRWYDKNKSGAIEQEELQAVLSDLGMLDEKSAGEASLFTANHMRVADAQAVQQGLGLSLEAFCKLYDTLVMNKARQQLRFRLGLQAEEDLKATFTSFASFGNREPVSDMDGAHFQKLCRDCDLLGKHLNTTDVDLIFAKVKTKGARKITFEHFITALSKLAEKKVMAFEDIVAQVLEAGGPIAHATKADAVRLHDDKSSYTGVYARGGPSNFEPTFDLSQYLDRSSPADVRGLKKGATPKSAKKVVMLEGNDSATPDKQPTPSARASSSGGTGPATPPLPSRTTSGALGGSSSRHHSANEADVTPLAGRDTADHQERRRPVDAVLPPSPIQPGCMSLGRRRSSAGGTGQLPVRASSLKDVLKEAFAGLRKDKSPTPPRSNNKATKQDTTPKKSPIPSSKISSMKKSYVEEPADLKDVFRAFAGFGIHTTPGKSEAEPMFFTNTSAPTTVSSRRLSTPGSAAASKQGPEMDGFRFAKLCREAGIVDSSYPTTSVDIVFAKVKAKGSKKISFAQFNEALNLISSEKGVAVDDVRAAIQHCGVPALNASTADAVRRSITYDGIAVGGNS